MNRVEMAANAAADLQPLELNRPAAPVLTPIIITLATGALVGGGVGYVAAARHGFTVTSEVPVRQPGHDLSSSELISARHQAIAG